MKAQKDIRSGNIMVLNRSGIIITVLQAEDNQILLGTYPESSYYSNNDVSGIKLTTSLLRKLLFNNEEDSLKWSGQGINIFEQHDDYFYGLRISSNKAKIQYLHELQNYMADFYKVFKDQVCALEIPAGLIESLK